VHADSYRDRSSWSARPCKCVSARARSDESARWLADRENAGGPGRRRSLDDKDSVLASVLSTCSQGCEHERELRRCAESHGRARSHRQRHASRRQERGFLVLKSPDIPSILVETAFISNPTEESRLAAAHQQRSPKRSFQGVRGYFYSNPPPGTLVAQLRSQPRDPRSSRAPGRRGARHGQSRYRSVILRAAFLPSARPRARPRHSAAYADRSCPNNSSIRSLRAR
jgi:N-acetylmuramoyl-L-alanine amidase